MLEVKGKSDSTKRLVILGGGSAGVSVVLGLRKVAARIPGLEVTLVDRKNYHPVLPLAYQVVTGSVAPHQISFPMHKLLKEKSRDAKVKFRQGTVQSVDVENKVVVTDNGTVEWDYLVLALGSTTNYFGMSDMEAIALPFRSVKHGIEIHDRIIENYEKALSEENEQRQRELLTFVVVGGGPTGVELSASIREFTNRVLARYYPSLAPLARVVLIEAQDSVLASMKTSTQRLAMSKLYSRGVELMLGTRISKAWAEGVQTSDGDTIPTDTVIWTAGIKPIPEIEALPFNKAKDGRILVNEHLQVEGADRVYALGDCAYLEQGKGLGPYPPTFQVAFRQGRVCAGNIVKSIKGKSQSRYRSKFVGQIFYIERNMAVAELFGIVFDGYVAAMMRRALFIGMLIAYGGLLTGLKNKLSAALDWTFAYFYNRTIARIE